MSLMMDGADKAERSLNKLQQKLASVQFAAIGAKTIFDNLGINGKKLAEVYSKEPRPGSP